MSESFTQAVEKVKSLSSSPSDDEKLQLYALYKQTTIGNVDTECPNWFNITARAKWYAWNEKKDIKKEDAEKLYVKLVGKFIEKYNIHRRTF